MKRYVYFGTLNSLWDKFSSVFSWSGEEFFEETVSSETFWEVDDIGVGDDGDDFRPWINEFFYDILILDRFSNFWNLLVGAFIEGGSKGVSISTLTAAGVGASLSERFDSFVNPADPAINMICESSCLSNSFSELI